MSENIELPCGWESVTLGEVTSKSSEKATPSPESSERFLGMDCIERNGLRPFKNYSFSDFKSSGNRFVVNQVLYGRMRPYLNKVFKATFRGVCSGEFIVLNCIAIAPELLQYVLHHRDFVKFANSKTSGDRPRITFEEISSYPIYLPPLAEQHRIVSKIEELFSSLDKGVESLKLAQQQLKVYRQAVLKWAFEGKLGPAKSTQFITQKNVRILDIAESLDNLRKPVNKSERSKRTGLVPYYGANGRTGWIDDFIFDEPLILVVEDETFVGRELPFSYKISGKSWVNNHAHILRPKKGTNIDFLNYQLQFYPFLPLTTGTTGRKKLTKHALMNAPVCTFSPQEQHIIVLEIENRLSICDKIEESIEQSLQQAEALRQSILKKAFEGKLVPQDPNDEPASVLLERIRSENQKAVKPGKMKKAKKSRQTELVFEAI